MSGVGSVDEKGICDSRIALLGFDIGLRLVPGTPGRFAAERRGFRIGVNRFRVMAETAGQISTCGVEFLDHTSKKAPNRTIAVFVSGILDRCDHQVIQDGLCDATSYTGQAGHSSSCDKRFRGHGTRLHELQASIFRSCGEEIGFKGLVYPGWSLVSFQLFEKRDTKCGGCVLRFRGTWG